MARIQLNKIPLQYMKLDQNIYSDGDAYLDMDSVVNKPAPFINATEPAALQILTLIEGNHSMTIFDTQKNVDSTDGVDYPKKRAKAKTSIQHNLAKPIALRSHLKNHEDWPTWKFSVTVKVTMFRKETKEESGKTAYREKSEKIVMEINLLQATLIHRDIQKVKAITSLANEKGEHVLDNLLTSTITCNSEVLEGWELMPNCRWILGGTTIHLATNWHIQSLVHFLGLRQDDPKFCQNLINLTSEYGYTPLHVAAVQDNTVVTTLLIQKKAKTEALNDKNQTALHLAAQSGSVNNVITLMYDGNSKLNVTTLDDNQETPLHVAKTKKILNILLGKVCAEELIDIEKKTKNSLFDRLLERHPASMKNYLDVMITSQSDDHLIYDFSIFQHGTKKQQNYLDKHLALMKHGCPEMLRHPLMALFAYTKWHPHKIVYYVNFAIFLAFLLVFTYHGFITIDLIQCESTKSNHIWIDNPDQKECQDKLLMNLPYEVTRYISCCLLGILIVWELAQLISKIVENEIKEYFSVQNITEVFMYTLSTLFFVIDFNDITKLKKHEYLHEYQSSILGWALFFAWTDLTIFLGRFDIFGGNIYTTWRIAKNVFWPVVVYVPSIMAFGTAFHCFLSHNSVFEGPVSSIIKVLTMVLGEYDFEDNFLFDRVKVTNDGYISVQIMLIMFILYGSLIIMNIIVALMVNQLSNVHAEIILATQRIQEITSLTGTVWFRKNQTSNNVENGQQQNETAQKIVCISSSTNENKWYCPGLQDILSLDDFYQRVRSGKKWEICHHKDTSYCEPCEMFKYQVPEHLIKLTLAQLEEKRRYRTELIEHIKTVQKETIEHLDKLEANNEQSHANYEVSQQTVDIPAGHELRGLILQTQDGTKVLKLFDAKY